MHKTAKHIQRYRYTLSHTLTFIDTYVYVQQKSHTLQTVVVTLAYTHVCTHTHTDEWTEKHEKVQYDVGTRGLNQS